MDKIFRSLKIIIQFKRLWCFCN